MSCCPHRKDMGDSICYTASEAIANGQSELAWLRFKIGVILFASGSLCYFGCVYITPWDVADCSSDLSLFASLLTMTTICNVQILVWALAPLHDDLQMLRLTMVVQALVAIYADFSDVEDSKTRGLLHASWFLKDSVLVLGYVRAMCFVDVERARNQMWITIRAWLR